MYIGSENQKINPYQLKFPFSFFWASWDQFLTALNLCSFPGRLLIFFVGGDNE